MNKHTIVAGISVIVALGANLAQSNTIGWNFASDWPRTTIQGDGTVDGFDQWTDSVDVAQPGNGNGPANSIDNWAVTTPINAPMVTVSWSSSNMYHAGSENNPEQSLYRAYLDDGEAGPLVTVTGLGAWMAAIEGVSVSNVIGYRLDFYRATDTGSNTFAQMDIYGGATTSDPLLETIAPMALAGAGNYPTGSGGAGSRLKQSAVGLFTGDTITFHTDRNLGGGGRAGLSGFKITAVPETSSTAPLFAFSGLALLVLFRRKTGGRSQIS